jgi:hypothetical protein
MVATDKLKEQRQLKRPALLSKSAGLFVKAGRR